MLQKNLGKQDRLARAVLSLILFIAAYATHSLILLALACFTLFEAVACWCPLYRLLGKNTHTPKN